MTQPHRLGAALPTEFETPLIDRSRPVVFTVDGKTVHGFEGDTVLSALLANGVLSAGTQSGHAVALDAASAPPVTVEGGRGQIPMALCPALDGAQYRTVGLRTAAAPLKSLFSRRGYSLGHDLGAPRRPGGWVDSESDETIETDFAVVGGGVAGLSAALAAARRGFRVVLLEREAVLGGMAVFFGKADGETPPLEAISGLVQEVERQPAISVLVGAEVFDLGQNRLRAVRVTRQAGLPKAHHIAVTFSHAVLATGTDERMPVYSGNRLPGVMGAAALWRLASRYGVWPGESFHLHTATNAGYRIAILGAEAGKSVHRASDPRPDPRTRFIEFCKAYGFRLGWGTQIAKAGSDRGSIEVRLADPVFGGVEAEPVRADALIVSGGWQPALALWQLAGGGLAWDAARHRLVPTGAAGPVVLAGAVAGFLGTPACIESGAVGVARLVGDDPRPIADPQIDPIYESLDGPMTVGPARGRRAPPAWFGPSRRAALAPRPPRGLRAFLVRQPPERPEDVRAAELPDVAGALAAGVLPTGEAADYCRQWCIVPRAFRRGDLPASPDPEAGQLPRYLVGRFGAGQEKWSLRPEQDRILEPGCLVFVNTDDAHPRTAIGVILAGGRGACTALMARTAFGEGDVVYVRDGTTPIPARLRRRE
ncbi:FAD-dependent oxidoreductase [Pelagibacterium limicola]|uniref:FAD-dependent oxidoreductase n=1 Tax=Pelagibacterium limicola TaxID=2791022 RepID=UPI0018B00B8B|nr:FAD-dependent oxidoreductase [Pelagibacterium limicola]